jgi:hypothetical protein
VSEDVPKVAIPPTIHDFIILSPPPGWGPAPTDDEEATAVMLGHLDRLAEQNVIAQYKERVPKLIVTQTTVWTITNDPDEVEKVQPGDGCPDCIEGNAKAVAFLRENPGRILCLGNMEYVEVWNA